MTPEICQAESKSPAGLSDSTHTIASSTTAVAPYDLSDWERTAYYNGISPEHPELLYRSDLLENPFPIPEGRIPYVPTKTVHGIFNTRLNTVWDTIAPQICKLLKDRKVRYSAVMTARFITHGMDGEDTSGPIVIWIATHPTTTAKNAHDVSPDILSLLKANEVEGVVVEWFEGVAERLSGPPLLRVTDETDPTYYIRRLFTAALGMPITTAEREEDDAQGSVALFFHENKDKHGNPSTKVFGVSNSHVLRKDTTITYEFKGAGAPPQHVRLAGSHRFRRGLKEIEACICSHRTDANDTSQRISDLEVKPKSEDPEEAAGDEAALKARRENLVKMQEDISILEAFHNDIKNQWGNIARRNIGHVDWAPAISIDIEGHRYTKDLGTFEVDAARFRARFKGNVVDLGTKFTSSQLKEMFYPRADSKTVFKFPADHQLRINGCVMREQLAAPDGRDKDNEPCLIVMKDGNTTDLTVGRYTGTETHFCDDLGQESIELTIYNYDKDSGPFSAPGDSGSLIFDGKGHMVGILHSGIRKGIHSVVTYATPAWWAIEQLKLKYPHANFYRDAF